MIKLWQRYLFSQALKLFFFFFFALFALYLLIDYSVHAKTFAISGLPVLKQGLFYLFQLARRAQILIPFAIVLTTIRQLSYLNQSRELVGFLAAGLSKKRLLKPLLLLGLFGSALLYLNNQFFLPFSLTSLKKIEDRYLQKSNQPKTSSLQVLQLQDRSQLIYQRFNSDKRALFDLYWVLSADELYRIKYLYPEENPIRGEFVDHLARNALGKFEIKESFSEQIFPNLKLASQDLQQAILIKEQLSLTALIQQPHWLKDRISLSLVLYRGLMPLTCLIMICLIAPACMRFDRTYPLFKLYACSIFGFALFSTMMQAAATLAGAAAAPPMVALLIPFGAIGLLSVWKFARLNP